MKKIIIGYLVLLFSTLSFAGHPETDALIKIAIQDAGEISPQDLKTMFDNETDVIILDIREREQRAEGQIYGDDMLAITRGNLEFYILNEIKNKDAFIVTYCRGGSRGALAAQTLHNLGYKNAINLKGGLKGWAKSGYPIETGLGVTLLSKEE
ncbi:MAG TPA: sulfurtransferase [Sulfurimonas sp.]|nr:sulfurtransferase [Sulfurimonas sp.]